MTKTSPFIATIAGAAIIALAASAQAFSGHGGHHHGSPALAACMAVAPQSTKANLRTTFKGSSLWTDKQAVQTAKNNLAQQILAKNTSLGQYEGRFVERSAKGDPGRRYDRDGRMRATFVDSARGGLDALHQSAEQSANGSRLFPDCASGVGRHHRRCDQPAVCWSGRIVKGI